MVRFGLLSCAIMAVSLSCVLLSTNTVLAGNEAAVFAQAQRDFQARRFSAALSGFQTVARTRPTDANCHYYMALCYQNLNQMSLANLEYQWVSSNSRDPRLKSQARAGLGQLSRYQLTRGASSSGASSSAPRAVASASAPSNDFARGRIKCIEFNTKTCHVCKIYDPIFDEVQHSNKFGSSCDFQRLDAEASQNKLLVKKYSITAFPTTVMADSEGKQISQFSGSTSPAGLESMIAQALQKVGR